MHHVVLGGAGFIGSHLVDSLLLDGEKVLIYDDFSTGRKANLEHLEPAYNAGLLQVEQIDLAVEHRWSPESIRKLDGKVDRIWHLASPASPKAYQAQPLKTLRLGTGLTDLACSLAKVCGARLLFASTSEVYGNPRRHPQPEWYRGNVSTTGPRAMYDEAKRCGETYATAWAVEEGVEIRIARLFNTYGSRMRPDDGRVVTNFIQACLAGEPMKLYGTGSQTRSFCFITDMVAGLRALMDHEGEGAGSPFNLGNPEEVTIRSLAERIGMLSGSKVDSTQVGAVQVPDPIGDDPERRCPDITKATKAFGWTPKVTLDQGLRYTIDSWVSDLS